MNTSFVICRFRMARGILSAQLKRNQVRQLVESAGLSLWQTYKHRAASTSSRIAGDQERAQYSMRVRESRILSQLSQMKRRALVLMTYLDSIQICHFVIKLSFCRSIARKWFIHMFIYVYTWFIYILFSFCFIAAHRPPFGSRLSSSTKSQHPNYHIFCLNNYHFPPKNLTCDNM